MTAPDPRLYRVHYERLARDASPRDTAETILTVLMGAVVVAMILFAWIAKEGM